MGGYAIGVRWSRVYLWTILATAASAIVLFIFEVIGATYLPLMGELFASLLLAFGFAVIGLACAAAAENGKSPVLMRSGMALGAVALLSWVVVIFIPVLQISSLPMRLFVWPTVWACLMALIGILFLLPMHGGWRWGLRCVTMVATSALGLFIAGAFTLYPGDSFVGAGGTWDEAVWERQRHFEEAVVPIGAAMTMLTAGLLVTTVIIGLVGMLTGRTFAATSIAPIPYWLQCPRCGCEQEARTGEYSCVSCKLRTRIDLA